MFRELNKKSSYMIRFFPRQFFDFLMINEFDFHLPSNVETHSKTFYLFKQIQELLLEIK